MTILGMVFRVQRTFPNMESAAMLHENINKMAKKSQKKLGWLSLLVMDGYCFRVQCALPNIEKMLCWMKNGNKIQKKSEKNRDGLVMILGGHCFQGPMCISKYGKICISR